MAASDSARPIEGTLATQEKATTSVWIPHHINALRARCTSCGGMSDRAEHDGSCGCGQPLPQAHW